MSEPAPADIADTSPDSSADFNVRFAALRASGADRFDPVRFRHLEALARRGAAYKGSVRRLLDARLSQSLAALEEHFKQARLEAGECVDRNVRQYPHAENELRRLLAVADFRALRRLVSTLEAGERNASLGALVRELERHDADEDGPAAAIAGSRPELKAMRHFRSTWSRLSVEKQVAQALEQAPKNPGPINSHMLVLRSLALMREASPDYLSRFLTYAETLLCLDQDEAEKPGKPKKRQAAARPAARRSR